jgi:hypothetical protein
MYIQDPRDQSKDVRDLPVKIKKNSKEDIQNMETEESEKKDDADGIYVYIYICMYIRFEY